MKKLGLYFGVGLCSIFLSLPARAFSVSLVGAYNNSDPGSSALQGLHGVTATTSASSGYGGGVLLRFGHRLGIETGALYLPRNASMSGTSGGNAFTGTLTSNYLMVPLMLQFHLLRFFSIGAGGYYGIGQGTTTETISVSGQSQSDSGSNTFNDYGYMASVGIAIPITFRLALTVTGNYVKSAVTSSYPISTASGANNTNTDTTVNANYTDFLVLAGFRLWI